MYREGENIMNQGLGIVLPLVLFFLIDVTLFANSIRQRTYTNMTRTFTKLSGCVMISQGLTALTYACDYHIVSFGVIFQYTINLISLSCMTLASYIWFEYLMITGENTEKYLSKTGKKIMLLPFFFLVMIGIPSQWTHWLFYIDANGIYRPGTLYFLQFMGYIYYFAAIIFTMKQIGNKKEVKNTIGRFLFFLIPTMIGTIINVKILRGGYTQIGCSYATFMLYLEQYIKEVNENRRLKSVETLNENLKELNEDLLDQMSIVGGLSNAYFSVYSVDLETGKCKAVKVIDFFRKAVENCHITSVVTKAFLVMCVMPEDREKMQEFTDWHTLEDRLDDSDFVVKEFHGSISPWEWCRAS